MARKKLIPRREFLKRTVAVAGAAVLGPAEKAHARKRKTHLHFGYGGHVTRAHGEFYLNIADRAAAEKKPFHFIVVESSMTLKGQRQKFEQYIESINNELLAKYESELKAGKYENAYNNMAIRGYDPFAIMLSITAVKHGLIIKVGEEYPSRKKIAELKKKGKQGFAKIDQATPRESTITISRRIREGLELLQTYMSGRDSTIARVTSKLADEIREKHKRFRRKKLRGLVQLGSAHHKVDDLVTQKGNRKVTVSEEFADISIFNSSLSGKVFDQIISSKPMLTLTEQSPILSLAVQLNIEYANRIRRGKKSQADALIQRLMQLTPREAAEIVDSVKGVYGARRANRILEQL